MRCGKCSEYIPEGIGIKVCPSCNSELDFSDSSISNKAETLPTLSAPIISDTPKAPAASSDEDIVVADYKKYFVAFGAVQLFGAMIYNTVEMRMDRAVAFLSGAPLYVLFNLTRFIVSILFLMRLHRFLRLLHAKKIFNIPAPAITTIQIFVMLVLPTLVGWVLPIYLRNNRRRY